MYSQIHSWQVAPNLLQVLCRKSCYGFQGNPSLRDVVHLIQDQAVSVLCHLLNPTGKQILSGFETLNFGGEAWEINDCFLQDYALMTAELSNCTALLQDYKTPTAFFKGQTPKSVAEAWIPVSLPRTLNHLKSTHNEEQNCNVLIKILTPPHK